METLRQREIVSHSSRGQNNKPVSFSNVLGLKKYVFLLLVWVFVLGQVQITKAQRVNFQTSPYAADKLINSEDIMIGFEEGETWVKVIVNLVKPAEVLAATDWDSRASLNKLQAEILTRHEEVLSTLSHNEFMLRYRFENQAAFSGEITLEGLDKLLNNPRVESIEPVYFLEEDLAQGIPLINGMVYRSTYNGQGVAIAIIDSGIDYTHPKLGGGGFPNSKVIGGYDFGDNDSDYYPNGAHGTCCAGIAAGDLGSTGDYIGGVAYNAKLYALKAKDSSGNYAHDSIIDAWNWCVTHKNDNPSYPILVISQSLSFSRHFSTCDSSYPSYATAADNLTAAGITILASSGNQGYCESISSPSCLSNVISVGAVYDAAFGKYMPCVAEETCAAKYPASASECKKTGWYSIDYTAPDMVGSFSNTASFLDMLAPSNEAYTTDIAGSGGYKPGDYCNDFGGTSAACPYAAGAVACLQSAAKAITGSYLRPSQIRVILLTKTGDSITDGKVPITKPRINLGNAIDSLIPQVCCPITISSFPYAEGFEADFGYWVNADGDDTDWTRHTGSTTSDDTGPSSAYEGSYYLYIESSSNYPDKRAVLDGPCFDLSSLSDPQLRFWYHMYGTSMGVLTVKVSDDNCANWTTVWTLSGNQGNAWHKELVDLSAYSGSKIKIQFVGSTGSSFTSDMAIDDVHLEDYVSQPPTISGYVKTSGGSGISGVTMTGWPGTDPVTNSDGYYSGTVSYGWSGTITPSKLDYGFSPSSRSYSNVTSDKVNQDYTAISITPTISGYVKTSDGSGISGVTMTGWPGTDPVTNSDGYYSGTVSYGWSGTITPSKLDYDFSPSSRSYSNVTSDKVNQDYTAISITPTISGYVKTSGGSGISGVTMTGWPGTDPVTNSDGYYSGTVSYGWSGTITPSKLGYNFSPPSISYSNVTSDKVNQDYTAGPHPPIVPQSPDYSQDFSSGKPGPSDGWEYYSNNEGRIEVVSGQLRMDDTVGNTTYSLNEAILHLNLTGLDRVKLSLDHFNENNMDENDELLSSFTGHADGDGIAISADGTNWHLLVNLTSSFSDRLFDLDGAVQSAGIAYTSDFRIKFQQYDNYPLTSDGRSFDNILVYTPTVIHVDMDATGGKNDGSTWADAFTSLQDALTASLTGNEIRVAQGIYKPADAGGSRTATFRLKSGVAVKGGYAGFGQPDPDARDVNLYESILSGDLDGNDAPVADPCDLLTEPTRAENCYHVLVTGVGTNETTVLDGFTITAGNADGTSDPNDEYGGGLLNELNSSPTIIDCTFIANSAVKCGGGMASDVNSSPTVTNCTFSSNSADLGGGGMHSDEESSSIVTNCTFSSNSADYGGGVLNFSSSPTLTNCTFSGNSATYGGGGMYDYHNSPIVTGCAFSGNLAGEDGGGMHMEGSTARLVNCTFSDNTAVNGNALACDSFDQLASSDVQVANCILWDGGNGIWNNDGSTITITYSDVQGSWPGEGNIDTDPCFVDPSAEDYHLMPGSPCIDAGDNSAVPVGITTDLDGKPRFSDDPSTNDTGKGTSPFVDMGAYEFQGIIGDFCGANSDQPDGYVDYWDLLYFAQRWHTSPSDTNWDSRCDLAKEDSYVDYWDLLVFAQQWHKGVKP